MDGTHWGTGNYRGFNFFITGSNRFFGCRSIFDDYRVKKKKIVEFILGVSKGGGGIIVVGDNCRMADKIKNIASFFFSKNGG